MDIFPTKIRFPIDSQNRTGHSGSQSPPLPPPPPPADDDGNQNFGRPRTQSQGGPLAPIVPDDQNLPGWVPKNYIEKGMCSSALREFVVMK